MTLDQFLSTWMDGGKKTREAFKRDVQRLLRNQRERSAWVIEKKLQAHYEHRTKGHGFCESYGCSTLEELKTEIRNDVVY